MNKKFIIPSLFAALFLLLNFSSCDNDIDIFSPDEQVTLVYGLLDADATTHKFKINKVFKGEDGVATLAKDPANSEYENISAKLIEFNNSSLTDSTGNSWVLNEEIVNDKEEGYFYYPTQKIYVADADLNENKYYKIEIDKLDGSAIVESSTELINSNAAILISPLPPFLDRIGLGLATPGADTAAESIEIEMRVPINAKVIEAYLEFSWHDEYYDGGKGPVQTISYKIGTFVSPEIPNNSINEEIISTFLIPTAFYEFIGGNVPVVPNGSNIKQRVPEDIPLNFKFVSGGDQFNTYLEVASPSTSLLETKPEYSNIINGVGLFSCRAFDNKTSLMSEPSITYLVDGPFTAGRKFCHSTSSTHAGRCFP